MKNFDKKQLEKQALEAIKKYRLFFITDVVSYLPCSRATFYNLELDRLDSIKEELENQKVEVKTSMRSKWYQSDNPTLQMGLMKLIATDEERKRLSINYTENKTELSGKLSLENMMNDDQVLETMFKIAERLQESKPANVQKGSG